METRKVQRVGYSTLTVSLPKDWTNEVGLKQGNIVTLKRGGGKSLILVPGIEVKEEETFRSLINADLCNEQELLTRIITGSYILGCDTFQVASRNELKPEHLEEIRNTTRRLTGISIVEQTPDNVTIQSFVDPNKFPVEGLIRRLHIIASSMQLTPARALFEHKPELAGEVLRMEEEVNRIYWLILRQLLLAQAGEMKIGLERPRVIVGNRFIAKCIEDTANYAENIATEVLRIKDIDYSSHSTVLEELSQLNEMVQTISDKTVEALFKRDTKLANDVIEITNLIVEKEKTLGRDIVTKVTEVDVATAFRSILWSLRQISKHAKTIAEIAINRSLSTPSEICRIERT